MTMKRIISYIIFATAVVLASCTKEQDITDPGTAEGISLDVKLSFSTKAVSDAPIVNSVRILAFDANQQCLLNTRTTDFTLNEVSDGYEITFDDIFALTAATSSSVDVFAVLNEDGYALENTESSLSSLLAALTVGNKELAKFNSYWKSRVTYTATPDTGTEPVFLMGASAGYDISEGDSQLASVSIDFGTIGRTMAQVTVDKISSDGSTAAACVIIQNVALVNVPAGIAWSTNPGSRGFSPVTIDFEGEGEDGWYVPTACTSTFRGTYSSISRTKSTSDRFYFVKYNNDDNKATMDFVKIGGAKTYNDNNNAKKAAENAKDGWSTAYSNLASHFASINPDTFTYTPSENFTAGTWTVSLGNSYYVPENITSTTDDCTCIRVRAAIAEPGLTKEQIAEKASWYSAVYKTNGSTISSTYNANNLKGYTKTESITVTVTNDRGKTEEKTYYVAYFDGLTMSQTASTLYVNELCWSPTEHIYDFLIPVNNKAFDNDYSVRRNTKYTVSLTVAESTATTLATKAAGAPAFGITANVTTETMNDYED